MQAQPGLQVQVQVQAEAGAGAGAGVQIGVQIGAGQLPPPAAVTGAFPSSPMLQKLRLALRQETLLGLLSGLLSGLPKKGACPPACG